MDRKTLKIPKSFSIGAQEISVTVAKDIKAENTLGLNKQFFNEIFVRTEFEGKTMPADQVRQTFYHELCHSILYIMNRHDLNADEDFVDNFAQYLYQFEKTKKT